MRLLIALFVSLLAVTSSTANPVNVTIKTQTATGNFVNAEIEITINGVPTNPTMFKLGIGIFSVLLERCDATVYILAKSTTFYTQRNPTWQVCKQEVTFNDFQTVKLANAASLDIFADTQKWQALGFATDIAQNPALGLPDANPYAAISQAIETGQYGYVAKAASEFKTYAIEINDTEARDFFHSMSVAATIAGVSTNQVQTPGQDQVSLDDWVAFDTSTNRLELTDAGKAALVDYQQGQANIIPRRDFGDTGWRTMNSLAGGNLYEPGTFENTIKMQGAFQPGSSISPGALYDAQTSNSSNGVQVFQPAGNLNEAMDSQMVPAYQGNWPPGLETGAAQANRTAPFLPSQQSSPYQQHRSGQQLVPFPTPDPRM